MGKKAIVIDGQGGMIGRQICDLILQKMPEADLTAIGTNSTATANMLKGRVKRGASGENPVMVLCADADIIIGPIGILSADSMLGEITPNMARAVGQSRAVKILIPVSRCGILIAGTEELSLGACIEDAAAKAVRELQK